MVIVGIISSIINGMMLIIALLLKANNNNEKIGFTVLRLIFTLNLVIGMTLALKGV